MPMRVHPMRLSESGAGKAAFISDLTGNLRPDGWKRPKSMPILEQKQLVP